MNLLLLAAGDDPDDIEGLAKSVGVLKTHPRRLCFVATCAAGCGTPVPPDRLMCPLCTWL